MNAKEDFDPNEWQGRPKRVVENNYKIFGFAVIACIILVILICIFG